MKKSISKKLEVTRKKTSRLWKHYRVEEKKIIKRKQFSLFEKDKLLTEKRDVLRKNISITWEDYRRWKFGILHRSRYKNFSFVKKYFTVNTRQEWYKSRERYFDDFEIIEQKLDDQIDAILNEPGAKGVMLIFRVRDDETELIHHVSDYVTRMSFDRLNSKGVSMYENLTNKLKFSSSVHEYEIKGIYIRIIYEKSKAG